MFTKQTAREQEQFPEQRLKELFNDQIDDSGQVDAVYLDSSCEAVIGISGLPLKAPAVAELMKNASFVSFLNCNVAAEGGSFLIRLRMDEVSLFVKHAEVTPVQLPIQVEETLAQVLGPVQKWAGSLNSEGEHIIDLKTPSPGPHFYVNLLMGNRVDDEHPLQTTPKSVVDRWGGGSFRSHAATQVLATRWDMRQEENGFPANRQFYLYEDNRLIFYSADSKSPEILSAVCRHSQNYTEITYTTSCGLEIIRKIFILPHTKGLPLATEVQRIQIRSNSTSPRSFRLVYTGMFGTAVPGALFEDVLYSNIIMQSGILKDANGAIAAVCPDYYPASGRGDLRFHTLMVHNGDKAEFPLEFCLNYTDFVGNGTLQNPEGALKLNSRLHRKGPGFFAVAVHLDIDPQAELLVDNFTGLVSEKGGSSWSANTLNEEVERLISRFADPREIEKALKRNRDFIGEYSRFLQVKSHNKAFDTYVNRNLPFQVLYQTFVSRSFCQTQKGYREIGFREIQDLFASMYYFSAMGRGELVKQLLKEWGGMVFEFGYAYHNFFWEGKEPGKWSDDALWYVQAVHRYINLTGDSGFLEETCRIAGTTPIRTRSVYKVLQSILTYSGSVSVGKHGFPLLDYADWNDCLKLDDNYITGPVKEERYRVQLQSSGASEAPLVSDCSESIMNAFLLKIALDCTAQLADRKGDSDYAYALAGRSKDLNERLQTHAWKGDFFARVLFNRYEQNEYSYLGALGDGLSADPQIEGSYFLNSFSWSILADCAEEDQIEQMLNVIDRHLKTPYGLKLVTPAALGKVASNTAADEYFPGDRENGGVFKHACMMATNAMFRAARTVKDAELAARLAQTAYWLLDIVMPFRTMEDPFSVCGNPRFCTQYNNSETGENVGPMLSGTSSWLTLSLMEALGVTFTLQGIVLDPILREDETTLQFILAFAENSYEVNISKPEGFCRSLSSRMILKLNGEELQSNLLPSKNDQRQNRIELTFE